MPRIEFQCLQCGHTMEEYFTYDEHPYPRPWCTCGRKMYQTFGFSFHRSLPEHFNAALGRHVTSARDFRDGLKRQSDEQSLRTGIEHNYVPVDRGDKEALGVDDEGLDSTRRVHREQGKTTGKFYG